jgi:tetratricopeptide (TPR) repeat protein
MSNLPSMRDIWDFNDPGGSEQRFRALIEDPELDPDERLQLRTQVARALGLQERFDEANAVLDDVEAALGADTQVARLRLLLERGRVLNSSGAPTEARPLFEAAWDLGRSIPHHDLAVDAAHMAAIVAEGEEARRWNEKAVEYAEESDDPDAERWLGSLYNNMGWDAHEAGDYQGALRLHQLCWEWHRTRNTGWGERVAKWSVAKQLRFLGQTSEALDMQRELLHAYQADEPGGEGFVHEEIAELLLASGDLAAARPHFGAAHEMLAGYDWVEADRLDRMRELAAE